MITYENRTSDYSRYQAHDIRKTVGELTPERKQALAVQIQNQCALNSLLVVEHNQKTRRYVEALLNEKRPKGKKKLNPK